MKMKLKGSIYLLFAFSLAGSSVISAKILANSLGAFTITSISLLFALILLLPLCGRSSMNVLKQLRGAQCILIVLQGIFGIFLFRMFLIGGLSLTSAFEAGILTGVTPAITTLLALIVLKEPLRRGQIAGILCASIGIFLIQGISDTDDTFSTLHLMGNILIICAAISESLFNILARLQALKIAARNHRSEENIPKSFLVQATLTIIVALVLCIFPALFENPIERLSEITLTDWLALIWYGIFVTAIAFICWYAGIGRQSAYVAAAFSGMMPFVSMILSVCILGETGSWHQCLGGLFVIAGIVSTGIASASAPRSADRHLRE